MLLCTTASAFPTSPRRLRPPPGFHWPFRLAAGARTGFALFGNGFFARALSAGGLRAFHETPGTPRCFGRNWASLLGGFSSNSAYHPTDNSADWSCYTTGRSSGDSTGSLFWDGRDLDDFG